MLKDKLDAEDATQEVLLKLWYNVNKFNLLAAKTWIMRTTHNYCIDILRKKNIRANINYSVDEFVHENLKDDSSENNPYIKIHLAMVEKEIKKAIKSLPENLRSVFVLYEVQGMKYKEISKALDIPLNTVKVYIMRARKKLQEELMSLKTQEVI